LSIQLIPTELADSPEQSPLMRAARQAAQVRYLLAPFNETEKMEIEQLREMSQKPLLEVVRLYQGANLDVESAAAMLQ
jgi:hypothetical protein